MKRVFKIIGGLVVLVVATVVVVGSVLMSMDYGPVKSTVERRVEDATGRKLTILGEFQVALSLRPKLTVTDVTLANAPWSRSGAPMVTLKRLSAEVALRPLLSGRLEVNYIELDDVRVVLETGSRGQANWLFQPKPERVADKPDALQQTLGKTLNDATQKLQLIPVVRDVRLRNVELVYVNGERPGSQLQANLSRADFTAARTDSSIQGRVVAQFAGVDIQAQTRLGSLAALMGDRRSAFPVTAQIVAPGLNANLDGTVDLSTAGVAFKVRLDGDARDPKILARLAQSVGVVVPDVDRMAVGVNLRVAGPVWRYEKLSATLGNTDLQGRGMVDMSGRKPRLTATLTAALLDLDQLRLGFLPKNPDLVKDPLVKRVFTRQPLPFDVLTWLDGDVQLTATRVRFGAQSFTQVRATANLDKGRLQVSPLKLTFEGGRVGARLTVDSGQTPPRVAVRGAVRKLDVGTFTAMLGQGRIVALKVDGEVDLTSTGASTQALAAALAGTVNVIGRDGKIKDKLLVDATEGIGAILPWASNQDANAIACVIVKLPISKGNAVVETAVLDTSGVVVRVRGNIDLPGEQLHLTVDTDAKTTSLASFAVPVRIKGPLLTPRIDVDPGDVVTGTVANIVKAPAKLVAGLLVDTIGLVEGAAAKKRLVDQNDPCVQALSGAKTSAKTSPSPPSPSPPSAPPPSAPVKPAAPEPQSKTEVPNKSSGDPVRDLEAVGKALKNLF